MCLRDNQKNAIDISIKNNFASGVHFHATGTGKSWIGLELILKYNDYNPNSNVMWICEQKTILKEQFNKEAIKNKGYEAIYSKYMIINYTEKKPGNWFDNINSARFWNKPLLIVINRAFLVSDLKYQKILIDISLIIHDECHSIINKTTLEFYKFILDKHKSVRCIGFSATPNLEFEPYNKILTSYTIYDAVCQNTILKPKICWIKSEFKIDAIDQIKIIKSLIKDLPYKKILVWCGIIEHCVNTAILWKEHFNNYTICIDTSKDFIDEEKYQLFSSLEKRAILFCACKHREGSDIKNLDCCIFLDGVKDRSPKTFVQCVGRVLRKDKAGKKQRGLIIDLEASSCIKICDRMNFFLNADSNFPWDYTYKSRLVNGKKIIINGLELLNRDEIRNRDDKQKLPEEINCITNIIDRFIRKCPDTKIYKTRLYNELNMIDKKNLSSYMIRAVDILEITNYIPHVTRGSCGSSLVCYLLGISNVDPVENNIKFERFLNDFRNNLPDIDFDFPHNLRDEVFLKLELNWPNKVARISNHVHWHEKSSLREALRKIGIKQQIKKDDINRFIKSLSADKQTEIKKYQEELNDTFRHYSLHCGGIVFFSEGVPSDIKINKGVKTLSQIIYDKNDIAAKKNFKIDILSSRAITQLIDIIGKKIDFAYCPYDQKTYEILQNGNNIGITLAESPLMRKAMLKIKPKCIEDIAKCLSIIRPAAKDARTEVGDIDYDTKFIYDDDAIDIISNTLNISLDLSDKFRRCLSKNKWEPEIYKQYKNYISKIDKDSLDKMNKILCNIRKYSFCKSHAFSYAQLVYKLAYQKAYNPREFWISTIKNTVSSYRKWVHIYEAFLSGVDTTYIINKNTSVYSKKKDESFYKLTPIKQIKTYGYWDMKKNPIFPNTYFYSKDGVYYFGGLIASLKTLNFGEKKKNIVFVCIGPSKYIEIQTQNSYHNKSTCIKGRAILDNEIENTYKATIAHFY